MTSPNPDWALIIHADSGDTRVDVYWVDIRAGRLGLALAKEVKAWRKRDDLLTLGQRFRVVDPPTRTVDDPETTYGDGPDDDDGGSHVNVGAPSLQPPPSPPTVDPEPPPLAPTVPQDGTRADSRREYLRGRVQHVLAHSAVAGKALQRGWPTGVPGLKVPGHSMDQLDDIQAAIEKVETDHSVPFYANWDDPEIARSIAEHPSNRYIDRWANPGRVKDEPSSAESVEARLTIQQAIMNHPRRALLTQWVSQAISGGINSQVDTTALAHALYEFASVPESDWPNEDLTLMLDGCLRTLGYPNGISDLGNFDPLQAPVLMSCAFAVAAGTATLAFGEDGSPAVIIDVIGKHL